MAAAGGGAVAEGRRILVAVDESEESANALRWCLRNIVRSGSGEGDDARDTLILLYSRPSAPVYSPMDTTENGKEHHVFGTEEDFVPHWHVPETDSGYMFAEEVTSSMDKYSRELADAVIERSKSICKDYNDIKVETKVSVGDARDVICESVNKLEADMLVMGSHGYGFIKRALLGSVSDHCARNANCPVLIIKGRAE